MRDAGCGMRDGGCVRPDASHPASRIPHPAFCAALVMKLHSVTEGWRIAIDQLRGNKLRSALTVLGVVIGIATVMAMASIVAGVREQIVNTLEVVGPTTFRIMRYFSTTGVNPDAVPREVRIRPRVSPEDAAAIARLPEIHYAAIWTQVFQRFEYGGN